MSPGLPSPPDDLGLASGLGARLRGGVVFLDESGHVLEAGLQLVGEGVETEQQADQLRAAGCTLLQGHLFGRARANW